MSVQRIATWKVTVNATDAIIIVADQKTLALSQATVADKTAEQIEAAIATAASTSNVELPELHAHVNIDGSIALLTGKPWPGHQWPEDIESD